MAFSTRVRGQGVIGDYADDALSEDNRDPPTIPVFIRQTYKTMSVLMFDSENYPYDAEFTRRIFVEGSPSKWEVLAVLGLAMTFILFRYFSEPRLKVSPVLL